MKLGKVIGTATSTIKHPALNSAKLLLVQPLNDTAKPSGRAELAIDGVSAGVGDTVLIVEEGAAAERLLGMSDPPVRTVIIGIVDVIDVLAVGGSAGVA
jgi:ethanolamine utilization protein EutN